MKAEAKKFDISSNTLSASALNIFKTWIAICFLNPALAVAQVVEQSMTNL